MVLAESNSKKIITKPQKQEFRFASLFGSGAVFQRDTPLPVWGKAAPFCKIRCSIDNSSAVTISDDAGNFKLYLPPQKAGTGKTLIAEEIASGRKIISENIAVGEVYLASGQSNIEFQLKKSLSWTDDKPSADDPDFRFFQVPMTAYPFRKNDVEGKWETSTAQSAGNFSAIAYHFAKILRKKLNVPVGIIGAYKGGTGAETFVSREALLTNSDFAEETAKYELLLYSEQTYKTMTKGNLLPDGNAKIFSGLDAIFPDEPQEIGREKQWHKAEFDDTSWKEIYLPDDWTAAGYNHAGVFWFRKTVVLPDSWAGEDIEIGIGAADKCDETCFNGEKIGSTGNFRRFDHWNTPRKYIIPGKLVRAGNNIIAIRVASAASISGDGGLIGPAEAMFLRHGDSSIPLSGAWKLQMEHDFGTRGMEFMRLLGAGNPQSLHMLFDNAIYPLIPYAMRGVVWYQGEANAICQTATYQKLLQTLIDDWRDRWGRQLDFIIIQLPGYRRQRSYDHFSQWAKLRDAQRKAAQKNGCDLVVTLKYGDVSDIHPVNKKPVGELAGLQAVARIQGNKQYHSPVIQQISCNDDRVSVIFDMPLTLSCGTKPETLMLAGSDGVFHPALGKIDGNKLTVHSPELQKPVKLRYAWSDNPDTANLAGENGLAVSPFEISTD